MNEKQLLTRASKLLLTGNHLDRKEAQRLKQQAAKLRTANKQRNQHTNNQNPILL